MTVMRSWFSGGSEYEFFGVAVGIERVVHYF